MANPTTLPGDLVIPGNLRVGGSISPAMARSDILVQAILQPFPIPWLAWHVWDAFQTVLPATPLTDNLGLVGGVWGTDPPSLQTEDHQDVGAVTNNYARAQIVLPWEYEAGATVVLRFHAGMITNIADQTPGADLDVVCYKSDEELGLSADLCATAATTMNSLTFADIDFTITATTLSPGDLLDVRIHTAIDDNATGAPVIGCIGAAKLLCDVR